MGCFNFKPSVRPVPMTVHLQAYPEKHYCPRMGTMNKPAYNAIANYSPGKPALIFVSSRRQTRLTAEDLISYLKQGDDPSMWNHMDQETLDYHQRRVQAPPTP